MVQHSRPRWCGRKTKTCIQTCIQSSRAHMQPVMVMISYILESMPGESELWIQGSTRRFWKVIHLVIEITVRLTVQSISCYATYDFTHRQITVRLTVQASRITLVMKMHLMDGNPCRGIIILIIRLGKRPSPIFHIQHCNPAFIPARCGMAQVCASVREHMCAKRMRYEDKHDGLERVTTHMHQKRKR